MRNLALVRVAAGFGLGNPVAQEDCKVPNRRPDESHFGGRGATGAEYVGFGGRAGLR